MAILELFFQWRVREVKPSFYAMFYKCSFTAREYVKEIDPTLLLYIFSFWHILTESVRRDFG